MLLGELPVHCACQSRHSAYARASSAVPPLRQIRSYKEDVAMGIGVAIFLIAVGAILRFAVQVTTDGLDIHMVGNILMIVGVIGALLSMLFWSSWGGWGARDGGDNVVVEGGGRARRTRSAGHRS